LRQRFESVNHDLFSQVVAQTAPGSADSRALIAWALAVHETGGALIALRQDRLTHRMPVPVDHCIAQAIHALARFYEHPDAAGYVLARDAVALAIDRAGAEPSARPLLDHLHLIRLALLDGQSAIADYMPAPTAPSEMTHAS
jgi:hypothetical protein